MSIQRIVGRHGTWQVAVARHSEAPTFTFDVEVPDADVTPLLPTGQTRLSCHNMTRTELEEHVRNCQAALAENPAVHV